MHSTHSLRYLFFFLFSLPFLSLLPPPHSSSSSLLFCVKCSQASQALGLKRVNFCNWMLDTQPNPSHWRAVFWLICHIETSRGVCRVERRVNGRCVSTGVSLLSVTIFRFLGTHLVNHVTSCKMPQCQWHGHWEKSPFQSLVAALVTMVCKVTRRVTGQGRWSQQ